MNTVRSGQQVRWDSAPKKQGGGNPFIGVLRALVIKIEAGEINHETEHQVIDVAAYYAKRNKLPFTPTLQGVVAMAADADKTHRMHMEAIAVRERDDFAPRLEGYDRATGVEL